jgi:hypothetical protein
VCFVFNVAHSSYTSLCFGRLSVSAGLQEPGTGAGPVFNHRNECESESPFLVR